MGKIRTRTIGLEDVEEKEKQEQKERAEAKKAEKSAAAKAKADKKAKKASSKAMEELKAVEAKEQEVSSEELGARDGEETKKSSESFQTSKKAKKPTRKIGKKHTAAKKEVDASKMYAITEAVTILKKIKYANFDESVELHLNVTEGGLKGEVELPNSTGKTVRVKVVDDKMLEQLEKGVIDFDVLVTHPSFMPKLAKFARTLGPKGLMPNPKAGTVSPNPEEVVKKFEKGTLRWKAEPKFPLVHQMIGKISHDEKALVENAEAFIASVQKNKIKAAFIKTTMSPSLKIQVM